ncbi:hypothetical protein B0T14DRAFT_283067 [Immersiella caudata]|uniref:Nephrocystin 3-like N-terminal domain-containing protein n=1 Tax=Immersiella caudata TaxID=314043 RepID=A0AA39WDZ2_9PEZI|nr:hypothetical protein B0T14DRAFT_283067 [Immersiella caudata]
MPGGHLRSSSSIILVHGLQGHPYRTWTSNKLPKKSQSKAPLDPPKRSIRRWLAGVSSVSSRDSAGSSKPSASDNASEISFSAGVFWPADLLPTTCPRARVLVHGYDTKVTNYLASSSNKNSIFSHAKDLLFALSREALPGRPLIFVAHSLGGIVVKEMLAQASSSGEPQLASILEATVAVVFLGTPHRGSPDLATAGNWARGLLSSLRFETTPAILHALGLRTTDLERAQEAFSGLWHKHDFRVKTFQEGLGLTGINLGVLGNKVVPDYSSTLGDKREHAETIQANHRDMCRFTGPDDPGYRKVSGELKSIYDVIENEEKQREWRIAKSILEDPTQRPVDSGISIENLRTILSISKKMGLHQSYEPQLRIQGFNKTETACLQSLWFPGINARGRNIRAPADGTCTWMFEDTTYKDWLTGESRGSCNGLLHLKGKPGAGKSVLMREAYRWGLHDRRTSGNLVAGFFFNGKGRSLERSQEGAIRSLLHQLLTQDRAFLAEVAQRPDDYGRGVWPGRDADTPWSLEELESELREFLLNQTQARKIFIFIDALDECAADGMRPFCRFWRSATRAAITLDVHLHVLMSSRHFPGAFLDGCAELCVDHHNKLDIAMYLDERFQLSIASIEKKRNKEKKWLDLRNKILGMSNGIFLWAVLAAEQAIERYEQGSGVPTLLQHLGSLPGELRALFSQLFSSVRPKDRALTVRLFRWAVLSVRPIRLHEWHHILAFIQQPAPSSLKEWRKSDYFTEDDDQLERKLRSISKGLLEITGELRGRRDDVSDFSASDTPAAGSFTLKQGETRVVQVIHESVRQFLTSPHDPELSGDETATAEDDVWHLRITRGGHISIMNTCLDYLEVAELDALVEARQQSVRRELLSLDDLKDMLPDPDEAEEEIPVPASSFSEKEGVHPTPISSTGGVDPMLWMASICQDADVDVSYSPRSSLWSPSVRSSGSAASSPSLRSQILEDYPALLCYVVDELFTHARLAQEAGDDLTSIFTRLGEEKTWDRWLALNEDELAEPCLDCYLTNKGFPGFATCGQTASSEGASDRDSEEGSTRKSLEMSCQDRKRLRHRLRRRGSVKSFRSAASSNSSYSSRRVTSNYA